MQGSVVRRVAELRAAERRRAAELSAAERRRAAERRAAERRCGSCVQSVLRLVHLWSVGWSVVRRMERLAERRVGPSCGALEAWSVVVRRVE